MEKKIFSKENNCEIVEEIFLYNMLNNKIDVITC